MVDSISGKSHQIQDSGLLGVNQQQSVERVNTESARQADKLSSLDLLDQANISDAARKAYEKDKEVLRFSRLAQRIKDASDSDRVAQLKNLVDAGRINEYLRSLNTESLASSLLSSPSGAYLKQ